MKKVVMFAVLLCLIVLNAPATYALDQVVTFEIDWEGLALPYDTGTYALFLNSDDEVVQTVPLVWISDTWYMVTYYNVDSNCEKVSLVFDDSSYNWDIGSPRNPVNINWGNPTPIGFFDQCWAW